MKKEDEIACFFENISKMKLNPINLNKALIDLEALSEIDDTWDKNIKIITIELFKDFQKVNFYIECNKDSNVILKDNTDLLKAINSSPLDLIDACVELYRACHNKIARSHLGKEEAIILQNFNITIKGKK